MESLFTNLGIDWKIIIAQIINFFILFFVFKKFFYRPILKILEERRQKIKESLKNAERIEEELRDIKERGEKELNKARTQGEKIFQELEERAKQKEIKLTQEANEMAERLLKDAKFLIEQEKKEIMKSITNETAELIVAALERILEKKADEEKDKMLAKELIEQIKLIKK